MTAELVLGRFQKAERRWLVSVAIGESKPGGLLSLHLGYRLVPWAATSPAGILDGSGHANEDQGEILHPLRTGGLTDAEMGVVRIEHVLSMRTAVHETRKR